MNTPSNAGKELKCPPNCGHSKEEHEAFDAGLACGGYYDDDECPNPYSDPSLRLAWDSGYSVGKINRTTPPTQSQEGEAPETDRHDFDESCGYDVPWSDFCRDLERRLTTAQRENDRLRSEVAGLKADRERLDWLIKQGPPGANEEGRMCLSEDVWDVAIGFADDPESLDVIAVRAAIDTARAATEEGKRG